MTLRADAIRCAAVRKLATSALGTARLRGAAYADARVIENRVEDVETKNGRVGRLARSGDRGIGVRVLAKGSWGFASTADLSADGVQACAAEAVAIAKASALLAQEPVELAGREAHQATWATPVKVDPFRVAIDRKIGDLLAVDEVLRRQKGVRVAKAYLRCTRKHQVFASTEGALIDQVIVTTGVGYQAVAVSDDEVQVRSYPNSFRGQHMTRGYELVEEMRLLENAPRVAEEAVALLSAPQCPSGARDIVLDGSQLGLQIHESCGHPTELDRVLGTEANYAGRSFLTTEKLGRFRYGSKHVNLVADATSPGGLGTFGYDDEGVPAQRWHLVKEGLFSGYLTSRETAPLVGLTASQGAMRAHSWNRIPLIRMTNISMEPGELSQGELLAGAEGGIYFETNRSWSIDQLRYNFQFGTEVAREIKGGKLGRLYKNATYGGITPEFWASCDGVGEPGLWHLWGTPNCGKGQPGQLAGTGHGASPARFRGVKVGVGYGE